MRAFLPNYCYFLIVVKCFRSHIVEFYYNRKSIILVKISDQIMLLVFQCVRFFTSTDFHEFLDPLSTCQNFACATETVGNIKITLRVNMYFTVKCNIL